MPLYRVIDVPADGACLFHCLSIARGQELADFKRGLGDFIVKHADAAMNRSNVTYRSAIATEFQVDRHAAPRQYASAMRRGDAWGGAIDISACVDLHGCPVRVYARSDRGDQLRPLQDFWPVKARRPLVRLLFENDHYQLVVRARPRGD